MVSHPAETIENSYKPRFSSEPKFKAQEGKSPFPFTDFLGTLSKKCSDNLNAFQRSSGLFLTTVAFMLVTDTPNSSEFFAQSVCLLTLCSIKLHI